MERERVGVTEGRGGGGWGKRQRQSQTEQTIRYHNNQTDMHRDRCTDTLFDR